MGSLEVSYSLLKSKPLDAGSLKDGILKTDKDVKAWGPEARLLGDIFVSSWKKYIKDTLKELYKNDLITNTVFSLDKGASQQFYDNVKYLGVLLWGENFRKVNSLLQLLVERAQDSGTILHKKDRGTTDFGFLVLLLLKHISMYIDTFPERIVHPGITKLINTLEKLDTVDIGIIKSQLDTLSDFGEGYLRGLTDVEAGVAWNAARLELAYEKGIKRYTIIAQVDDILNPPCSVCMKYHGKVFNVIPARNNLIKMLKSANTDKFAKLHPFPRIDEIEGLTEKELRDRGDLPSFHEHCRCVVEIEEV